MPFSRVRTVGTFYFSEKNFRKETREDFSRRDSGWRWLFVSVLLRIADPRLVPLPKISLKENEVWEKYRASRRTLRPGVVAVLDELQVSQEEGQGMEEAVLDDV